MNDDIKQYFDTQFRELRADMATKSDLAVLETGMATKDDLTALRNEMATSVGEMISGLATHVDERFDELKPFIRDVDNHEKRIKYLEDKLPKLAQA